MFDQVAGHERKNSMVLSQAKNFFPVERREIPIRNALDPLRSQLRASQRAQELQTLSCGFFSLLPCQHQEFGVGGENLAHGILILATGLDALANFLDQCVGNMLLPFFSVRHKAEVPGGMTVAGSTVAGWVAAADLHLKQRAGQEIFRNLEAAEEFQLALPQADSLRAFGFPIHLGHFLG